MNDFNPHWLHVVTCGLVPWPIARVFWIVGVAFRVASSKNHFVGVAGNLWRGVIIRGSECFLSDGLSCVKVSLVNNNKGLDKYTDRMNEFSIFKGNNSLKRNYSKFLNSY